MSPKNESRVDNEEEALNLSFNNQNKEVKLSAKMRLKKQRLIEIEKENSRLRNLVAAVSAVEGQQHVHHQQQQHQQQHHFEEDQTSALHRLAEAAERKQVSTTSAIQRFSEVPLGMAVLSIIPGNLLLWTLLSPILGDCQNVCYFRIRYFRKPLYVFICDLICSRMHSNPCRKQLHSVNLRHPQ